MNVEETMRKLFTRLARVVVVVVVVEVVVAGLNFLWQADIDTSRSLPPQVTRWKHHFSSHTILPTEEHDIVSQLYRAPLGHGPLSSVKWWWAWSPSGHFKKLASGRVRTTGRNHDCQP